MPDASEVLERLRSTQTAAEVQEVLRCSGITPGLSKAFFLAVAAELGHDPAEAVRLGSLWQLVRKHSDEPAWAYRAKGGAEIAQGQYAKAAQSFLSASRAATDPVQKLTFQVGRIDCLARLGKVDQAVAAGQPLAKELFAIGERFQAARVLLAMANALLWQDRQEEAMKHLRQALPELPEDGVEYAMASLSISTANLHLGLLGESKRHAESAREAFRSLGFDRYAELAEVNAAQVLLLQGRADQAMDLLLQLQGRQEGEESTESARLSEFLGDAYLKLNLWPEARDSYSVALRSEALLPKVNVADCIFGVGQALAAQGDRSLARTRIRQARGRFLEIGNRPWASLCSTSVARTYLEEGRFADAYEAAKDAFDLCHEAGSPWSTLQASLTLAECQPGNPEESRRLLKESARLVKRHGFVSEAWRVEYLQARLSEGSARLNAFRRMLAAILEGRMLTTSVAARSSFLRDKQTAVREFLDALLEAPTKARVREARQIVEQSRAAALLDEIALAGQGLGKEALERMEALRDELNSVEGTDRRIEGVGQRLNASELANLQRRWSEATRRVLGELAAPKTGADASRTAVLVETESRVLVLSEDRAVRVEIGAEELRSKMRWLEFELMAPLATPEIDGFSAREELKELGNLLLLPWISDQPGNLNVSPDGHLWRVPWQAVATAVGVEGEIALAMHPSCRIVGDAPVVSAEPRVLLWVSRDEALPYIQQEAAMIQEIFPNARLCETAKDVRDSMRDGDWDVVHVAAHASHCNSNPMFSFFEISGEPIYATEIAQSGFTAKLSVLSACETGSLSYDRKDEPDGLARAFLARRASAVVGSAWRLDDEAAAVMMSVFYKTLAEKGGIVDAMRDARTAAQSRWDHPYYWAPLVLFGGYV